MSDALHGSPGSKFRLPAEMKLGRVHLQIADLTRSIEYYTEVLGFRVLDQTQDIVQPESVLHRRVTLGPHGSDLALLELIEHPGAIPVPRTGRLGLYHFAILLPSRADLGAFVRHLADANVRAGMADHAVSEAVYLTDPDGLGIEVYADRPRSEWRYEGRQLFMTTAPLDVGSLVDTARTGGVVWHGMPAGTVIGHVHLHVGDLDVARAFYHDALGLDMTVWSYPGALFMSAGGYHHHLAVNTWAANAPQPERDDAQLRRWEMIVPGIQWFERIAANMKNHGFPVIRQDQALVITDPWQTRISVQT